MIKKDENIREEINRDKNADSDEGKNANSVPVEIKKGQTEVKNANAAGLGSMGRNDEKELDNDSQGKQNELDKY